MNFVSGSIYVRATQPGLLPGEKIEGHKHRFDHTSILFNGMWRVRRWMADDMLAEDFEREGPFHLLIDKDCRHEFTFLGRAERGIMWCVYSHRTPDGEVAEEYTGWNDAYIGPAA